MSPDSTMSKWNNDSPEWVWWASGAGVGALVYVFAKLVGVIL